MNENDLELVSKILLGKGFIQGKFDYANKRIILATRNEKIHQKLHTHEIISFLKYFETENIVLNIDINFLPYWKGNSCNISYEISTDNFLSNIELIKTKNLQIYMLNPLYQFIQLCLHVYSEAVFFCWEPNWMRDKSEIDLIRFVDIYELIKRNTINFNKLDELITSMKIIEPIIYACSLLNLLYPQIIPKEFINKYNFSSEIIDIYYDKSGQKKKWKLSFYERLFKIKEKAIEIEKSNIF